MRAYLKTPLLFFCLLPLSEPLAAQQLTYAPAFRNYSTDQGLPNNWVYGIQQDRAGYIWVSTNHGVCRFNGYEFEQFPDTLSTNYTSVFTDCFMEDSLGRMWYVDFQSRIFYIENDRIHPYRHNHVLAQFKNRVDFFRGLVVGGNGADIWLSARNLGILHISADGTHEVIAPDTLCSHYFFRKNGRMLKCDFFWPKPLFDTGFFPPIEIQNEQTQCRSGNFPLKNIEIVSSDYFYTSLSPNRYLIKRFDDLYLFEDCQLVWRSQHPKSILYTLQEQDGTVWLGGTSPNKGLYIYRSLDDLRMGIVASSYLTDYSVSIIFKDREGGYWIGTQQAGVFYCPAWGMNTPQNMESLRHGNIQTLATDRQHTLYVGTESGAIFELNTTNNTARDISPKQSPFDHVEMMHYDAKSRTLGVAGSPINFYREGVWGSARWFVDAAYSKVSIDGRRSIGARHISPSGTFGHWHISTRNNEFIEVQTRPEKIVHNTSSSSGKFSRFYVVKKAPDHRVWASRHDGLFEWLGDSVLRRPEIEHPAFLQTSPDIQYLSDGSLVLCPKGFGVVIWKPGSTQVLQISQKDGLRSNKVETLHIAPGDIIWACTQKGLSKLTPQRGGRYRVDNFTVKHGLPSNTVNDVATLGDDVWVATAKGLFRLKNKPFATTIPAPFFPKITVNNTPYPANRPLVLPYDSADVNIEYLSLHYRSGGIIPYRFRLRSDLSDTTWRYTTRRSVYFSNLAPGVYRIEVQAQNEDGLWSALSVLPVIIRPPWWATWWARMAGFGLLGGIALGYYKWRIGQIRRNADIKTQIHRLEQSALQAQMNPHFIFNCLNSIQQFILSNEKEEAARFLSKFATLVRDTLNASVNGEVALEDEVRMLDNYLQLECLRFQGKFEYEILVDENLDIFDTTLPPIVVQPFVENAILHGLKGIASGGKIRVEFFSQNDLLCVRITDNGSGFRPNAAHPNHHPRASLGISRTQKRFALLREKYKSQAIDFEYNTNPSTVGTEVLLQLPFSGAASSFKDSNFNFPKVSNFRKV